MDVVGKYKTIKLTYKTADNPMQKQLGLVLLVVLPYVIAQRDVVELDPSPTAVNASGAYGLATVGLNGVDISFSIITTGLSGPINASHFHIKPSGQVVFGICGGTFGPCAGNYLTGIWRNASNYLMDFAAGRIYLNVHTSANLAGEIRGDVMIPTNEYPQPVVATELKSSLSGGHAIAELSFDVNGSLKYDIVATNLTGPITMAHFHLGTAGVNNGLVLFTICKNCTNDIEGVWPGARSYFEALASAGIYINLHTAAFPGGEIRGQALVPADPRLRAVVELDATDAANTLAYALAIVDLQGASVRYWIAAAGLTGPIVAAHFHSKPAAGAVVFPICTNQTACGGNFLSGTWDGANLTALAAGDLYINVHTAGYPHGEVLGYLTLPSPPAANPPTAAALAGPSPLTGTGIAAFRFDGAGALEFDVVATGLSLSLSLSLPLPLSLSIDI